MRCVHRRQERARMRQSLPPPAPPSASVPTASSIWSRKGVDDQRGDAALSARADICGSRLRSSAHVRCYIRPQSGQGLAGGDTWQGYVLGTLGAFDDRCGLRGSASVNGGMRREPAASQAGLRHTCIWGWR